MEKDDFLYLNNREDLNHFDNNSYTKLIINHLDGKSLNGNSLEINSLFNLTDIFIFDLNNNQRIILSDLPNLKNVIIKKSEITLILNDNLPSLRKISIERYYYDNNLELELPILNNNLLEYSYNENDKRQIILSKVIDNHNYLEKLETYEVDVGFHVYYGNYNPYINGNYIFILEDNYQYITDLEIENCYLEYSCDFYPKLKRLKIISKFNLDICGRFPVLENFLGIIKDENININFNRNLISSLKVCEIISVNCKNLNINDSFTNLELLKIWVQNLEKINISFINNHKILKMFIFKTGNNIMLPTVFNRILSFDDLNKYKNRIVYPMRKSGHNIF